MGPDDNPTLETPGTTEVPLSYDNATSEEKLGWIEQLGPNELEFFKQQTGIENEAALKNHIISIQAKAYKVHPYPCIKRFAFATLKVSRLPAYKQVLQLGRERENAIFLDAGCCFGNDARKAVADGFPISGVIASDLPFWDLGHELFKSTPESFPVPFIAGDMFDPAILQRIAPASQSQQSELSKIDLAPLTSLNLLHGRVSAIHASSFFHLFDFDQQSELAKALAGLLSPQPGCLIFGSHIALPIKGFRPKHSAGPMSCHSPESWTELWDGVVFGKGEVKVNAFLKTIVTKIDGEPDDSHILIWSVTRL